MRTFFVIVAVALGVGIAGASSVYGDIARAAFFDDLARGAAGVDAVATAVEGSPGASAEALATVAGLPGVAHAALRADAHLGVLGRNGRVLTNDGELGEAIPVPSWSGFAPFRLTAGRLPQAPGEVALDAPTAARESIAPGGTVAVVDRDGVTHDLAVVGVVDFGVSAQYDDRSVTVLDPADLERLATVNGPAGIVAAARPGVDQATLAAAMHDALGPGYDVATGADLRAGLAKAAGKYVDGFQSILRVTALVALVAAVLVVYNTFQIVVAQRSREHALLRCIGAGRRQIVRLVLAESVMIGAAAAVVSVAIGIGAGYLLAVGQGTFGRGIPDFHLIFSWKAVVIPALTAVAATVVSATLPALAAGRVSPMLALRDADDARPWLGRSRTRRWALLAVAAALVVVGSAVLRAGRGRGFDGLPDMIGGAMIMFTALVLVLPLGITALTAPLRRLLARPFGPAGRLAVDNARRHPVRSAATTTALVIGLAPMTALAVLLTTAQAEAGRELAENFPVDFVVSHNAEPARPFGPDVVDRVRAAPEFGVVAIGRVGGGLINGDDAAIGSAESGVLGPRLALEVREGSLAGLPRGTVAVRIGFAYNHNLTVGDSVQLGPDGHTWPARIVATYDDSPVQADALANWDDFTASGLGGNEYLLIRRADGATATAASAALDQALTGDPLAEVASDVDQREALTNSLGRRLAQFNVLLGVTMVIAVLGIMNTLFLSVFERTRESGLLRAIGLGRRQLYGMLLIESLLTAAVGAVVGVAFGLGLGWTTARQLIAIYGHGGPTVPVGTIAIYVAVAVVGAALASILPARRAAGASIVSAVHSA